MSFITKRLGYGIWGTVDGQVPTDPIIAESGQYTQAFENNMDGSPIYIGEALPGTSKGASLWRIKKITYSGTTVTDVQWADGVSTFTKEWDERATYTYS